MQMPLVSRLSPTRFFLNARSSIFPRWQSMMLPNKFNDTS